MVLSGREHANPLGITEHRDVRVVCREQELPTGLCLPQFGDDPICDEGIVKVVLRLIHEKGINVLKQQHMQDCGALLTRRELVERPVDFHAEVTH